MTVRRALAAAVLVLGLPPSAAACAVCIGSAFGDRGYTWPYIGLILMPFIVVAHHRRPRVAARLATAPAGGARLGARQSHRARRSFTQHSHGDDMSTATAAHGAAVEPAESPLTPESWGNLGMWIFLAGDAVGFGTLLAGYGAMRATSADWPNPGERLGITLTAFMTFLLICSSVTMVKALEWLSRGDKARAKMFLAFTALGGTIFVSMQAYEWTHLIHRGLHINGNPWGAALFGTSFFLVTGFHGLHVTAGVIYLLATIGVVSRRPDPMASYNFVEITGLYWHFVDLVWIMVFTFMYLL